MNRTDETLTDRIATVIQEARNTSVSSYEIAEKVRCTIDEEVGRIVGELAMRRRQVVTAKY